MKKLLFGVLMVVLPMAGCGCGEEFDEDAATAQMQQEKDAFDASLEAGANGAVVVGDATDLTVCGEFEAGKYDEALVESKYAVCVDASTGACYIKTFYPRPKPGCDLQFGTYRNGNPACFDWINNIHAMDGKLTAESQTEYRPGDTCGLTTEAYFRGKMPPAP